jgi:hypothetical protein
LESPAPVDDEPLMVAWAPDGLAPSVGRYALDLPGVVAATTVGAGLAWKSHPEGRVPVEVASVSARYYARMIGGPDATAIRRLRKGDVVVAETMSRIWDVAEGDTIDLGSRSYDVVGIASDEATMGYEALLQKGPSVETIGNRWYLLARLDGPERIDKIRGFLKSYNRFAPMRVKLEGETPFLRQADAVASQLALKDAFGEFAITSLVGEGFGVDKGWRRKIVERSVPLLGRIKCHRDVFPQIEGAMLELMEMRLSHVVDPSDFAGCYSPRFINRDLFSGQLSHHAWGVALDINASLDPLGSESNQPRPLVRVMKRWGFNWGGKWLTPDPMHFEWARFPED